MTDWVDCGKKINWFAEGKQAGARKTGAYTRLPSRSFDLQTLLLLSSPINKKINRQIARIYPFLANLSLSLHNQKLRRSENCGYVDPDFAPTILFLIMSLCAQNFSIAGCQNNLACARSSGKTKRQKKVLVIASIGYSIKRFSKLRHHKVKSQSDEGNYSYHISVWLLPSRSVDYQQLIIRSGTIITASMGFLFLHAEFVMVSRLVKYDYDY